MSVPQPNSSITVRAIFTKHCTYHTLVTHWRAVQKLSVLTKTFFTKYHPWRFKRTYSYIGVHGFQRRLLIANMYQYQYNRNINSLSPEHDIVVLVQALLLEAVDAAQAEVLVVAPVQEHAVRAHRHEQEQQHQHLPPATTKRNDTKGGCAIREREREGVTERNSYSIQCMYI